MCSVSSYLFYVRLCARCWREGSDLHDPLVEEVG